MKTYLLILVGIMIPSVHAQTSSLKPKNAPLQQSMPEANSPAAAHGNVSMARGISTSDTPPLQHIKGNKTIPDGTYGSNRTGQVYSPSNPNFPYDQTGKIPASLKDEVITTGRSASHPQPKKGQTLVMPKPTK